MWWHWVLITCYFYLQEVACRCDPTLSKENYVRSTEVDFSVNCTTNQVKATYQRKSSNLWPITVQYSCVTLNSTIVNGTIIDGQISSSSTEYTEILCGSVCSFDGCYTNHIGTIMYSISETCFVCAQKESDACTISNMTVCSESSNPICTPSVYLEDGTLNCTDCIECNNTEGVSSDLEYTSEIVLITTLNINTNDIIKENTFLTFLVIILVSAPITVLILTAAVLTCQMKWRKKRRIKEIQLHIDEPVIPDFQVNLFTTTMGFNSDSMWSIFDSFHQDNFQVSENSSSSSTSSFNCENSLIDESGYIITKKSGVISEQPIVETCDTFQCNKEIP